MEIPIWVAFLGMLGTAIPGVLAYLSTRKQQTAEGRAKDAMAEVEGERVGVQRDQSAIEGFVRLVESMRVQMEIERQAHESRVDDLERECKRKLGELHRKIEELKTHV